MRQINSYLHFNGNCREAMTFYKECLGGQLILQTVGESPMADKMPIEMKDLILHATLINGELVLLGSDMSPENLIKGNAVDLMLDCRSDDEIRTSFDKLSANGTIGPSIRGNILGCHIWQLYRQIRQPLDAQLYKMLTI